MIYKQITELTLRSGDKIYVTVAEGNSVRNAKAGERAKSIMFPSLRNRMVDSSHVVDIQDKTIEDPVASAKERLEETQRNLLAAGLLEPKQDSRYMPGYLSYIVASIKLRKKSGKSYSDIKRKLDEKQTQMITDILEAQGLAF